MMQVTENQMKNEKKKWMNFKKIGTQWLWLCEIPECIQNDETNKGCR